MKPLGILIGVFGVSCLITYLISGHVNYTLSGRIAMAVMLMFTAIAHFKFVRGMMLMLPPFIPAKKLVVWFTGVAEIILAIGLLTPSYRLTGWFIIAFFMLITPANIYASRHYVNLEKADYTGNGLKYLWFRVPLQLFFIAWVWYFAVLR